MRLLVSISAALLLFGCSKPTRQEYADYAPGAAPAASTTGASVAADASAATDAPGGDRAKGEPGTKADPGLPASTPMLAYSYRYGVEAPPANIRPLLAKHEAACATAGIVVCQVTGSTVQASGKDTVTATLTLRATPAWLKKFRDSLAGDAKSAGGRVTRDTVASEDLSRQIVDVEATVRAKTALRDRLQALLESRPGKTSDLFEVETALSRVQGELDANRSELAVMRERVATSDVTIEYKSADVFAPEGAWAPLSSATHDIATTTIASLALMVRLIAGLLPWVVVGALLWIFRKRLAKPTWPWRRGRQPRDPPAI